MLLYYFNFIAKVRKILKSTLTSHAVPEKTWLGLKRKPKAAREYWSFPVICYKLEDIWWQVAVYILKTDKQWKKPRLLSMFMNLNFYHSKTVSFSDVKTRTIDFGIYKVIFLNIKLFKFSIFWNIYSFSNTPNSKFFKIVVIYKA